MRRPAPRASCRSSRLVLACLAGLTLAACDKCGNRVHINAPTLQHACGDDARPAS